MRAPFVALVVLAASATCGPKPQTFPMPLPDFEDAGQMQEDGGMPVGDCAPCEAWQSVEIMGPLPAELDELSGLAVSRAHPGVLYAHNDSGDRARFFALTTLGVKTGEYSLNGVMARDWEDMAIGPCEAGTCLFLADIGDNLRQRSDYAVYRVTEPGTFDGTDRDIAWERLAFSYPGGERHNAETLLVHPVTGDVYVVTKETSGTPSLVFRFPRPFAPTDSVELIAVGPLSVPAPGDTLVTGGDISPCGNAVVFRLYNRIVQLLVPDAGPFEAVFSAPPVELPQPIDEPQGEAVAYGRNGQSYFTASEMTGQSVHRVQCTPHP